MRKTEDSQKRNSLGKVEEVKTIVKVNASFYGWVSAFPQNKGSNKRQKNHKFFFSPPPDLGPPLTSRAVQPKDGDVGPPVVHSFCQSNH